MKFEKLDCDFLSGHDCAVMDCDAVMMHVAKPSFTDVDGALQPEGFAEHLGKCTSCSELCEGLLEEAEDEHIGREIGAYQIQSLLGKGGMGRVYLATHPEILSRVAIKVFSKDWNAHPTLVARFFTEARATNVIDHKNIVTILDVGRLDDGRPYMVMEYLKGQALSALVGQEALTDTLVTSIMLEVLSALSAAHEHKIIHRDLKPDNIFVSPEGRATLLDFGIAKLVPDPSDDSAVTATATGLVLGTPQYMSPEQATGDPIDYRTDIYAMGIILYECYTGLRPFEGSSLYRLMDQHVNAVPTSPTKLRPDLDPALEAIIMRALAKKADARFQSMSEMHDALADCDNNSSASAFLLKGEVPSRPVEQRDTKSTVAASPAAKEVKDSTAQVVQPASWGLRIALPLVAVASVVSAYLLWPGNETSTSEPALVELPSDAARTATSVIVQDASVMPQDSAVLSTSPIDANPGDVAIMPAVKIVRPAPLVQRTRKSTGIAPISYLSRATRAAQAEVSDAILTKVLLYGIDKQGRVDTSQFRNHVYFDFMSPRLVRRAGDAKFGRCKVRVEVGKQGGIKVERLSSRCSTLRVLMPPSCPMAILIKSSQKKRRFPDAFTPTSATYSTSSGRRATPMWRFKIDGVNYSPVCP
ncbi:MAG: serine/threonine protein kinase [Kofleriaceae bacterium]|nr:serine/threonine protein kinase [Kofleriaceae bacterium]